MNRQSRRSRPIRLLFALGAAAVLVTGCSSATEVQSQPAREATAVPTSAAKVPPGWVLHRGPGFLVALPPTWTDRPAEQRVAPSAPMEIGLPFTGQRNAPPAFMGFIEREQVGPLDLREQVLRMQLQAATPEATLGAAEHVSVAGGTDAVSFDLVYTESAGTSLLDTPLDETIYRQRELIVQTPGLPKFGFRYAAAQNDFDLDLWQQIRQSIVVIPAEATATATPNG